MLRDGRQVALDQVIEALMQAGNVHQQGAGWLETDPDRAHLLQELAARRRAAALDLGEQVRLLGGLPSEPDADLETAKDVLARVQLALADDARDEVLEHSRQAEAHLAQTVEAALEEDLPSDARSALRNLLTVPELAAALGS